MPKPIAEASMHKVSQPCWLGPVTVALPTTVQAGVEIDALLQRPAGWLEERAGIQQRRLWAGEDPLDGAAAAAGDCLKKAGLSTADIGALLLTSEAPPLLLGLAAALHQRLGLPTGVPALEIGGACTGFLTAMWMARGLVAQARVVLLVAVEAPSRFLKVEPGLAGEAAALFGDGAAAAVICDRPVGTRPLSVIDVALGADGSGANLLQVKPTPMGGLALEMKGQALAARAVRTMAEAARRLASKHGLACTGLQAIIAHGGNGRMPALVARQLGMPAERVWSETARAGNLGSASLPTAWAARTPVTGHVLWTAVGAGLTWGAALLQANGLARSPAVEKKGVRPWV
jgi:3-oxoacyl-[acyl-carrier-protein] synthase-3